MTERVRRALLSRLPLAEAAARYRAIASVVALAAGLAVFVLAHEVFPFHSSNSDEGVYLQQAAMLLEGKLFLRPGSEALREAVHPWFFVESPRGLYPKYNPVPAALFAIGKLAGGYRLALGAIASVNVALTYVLASQVFDRRTGVMAAGLLAAAPLFLISSAVFLPYAPTTALNLLFAVAYVRAVRRRANRYAVIAGAAIGLAFFARPYTAVLFAAPFILHAVWRLARARSERPGIAAEIALIAVVGASFVGLTLAYNAFVTGSALLFPYEAFAPQDGVGFGHRAILGHELDYTPRLAIVSNAMVIRAFARRWFTAGVFGTGLALAGLIAAGIGVYRTGLQPSDDLSQAQISVLVAGIGVSVIIGNVFFWGNRNILAALQQPGDGLISLFGPFYHFDLLIPAAVFAAHAVVTGSSVLRGRWPETSTLGRVAVVLLLVVTLPLIGATHTDAVAEPIDRNSAYTAKYEQAYAPFIPNGLTNALVFLPPTYGEWRNHPFQWLRNDPGFDGPAVYAISRDPSSDFAVLDEYPGRQFYRYQYHGEWTPDPSQRVIPVLQPLSVREGSRVAARTTVTIPERITGVSVSISNGESVQRFDYTGTIPRQLSVEWILTDDSAAVNHSNLETSRTSEFAGVPVEGSEEIVLTITITEPSGATLTYRAAILVQPGPDTVRVLWPPAAATCTLVTDCGLSGTYVPDRPDTRPTGIQMNSTIVEVSR